MKIINPSYTMKKENEPPVSVAAKWGGVNIPDTALANADEICALRDQVHNLTLYLKEAFKLCPDDLEVLNDWHPGLPGYAPEK